MSMLLTIVNNHVVEFDSRSLVFLRDILASFQKETITKFPTYVIHNVRHMFLLQKKGAGSRIYMILALWIHVTRLRLFLKAKSKAKRAIRSVFARVTIFNDSTTPG